MTPIDSDEFERTMATPEYVKGIPPLSEEMRFAETRKAEGTERAQAIADAARRFAAANHDNIEGYVLIVLPKYNASGETRLKVEVGGTDDAKAQMLAGLMEALHLQLGTAQARKAMFKGPSK